MNYSSRKKNKKVKFIIIHYTGMKNLKFAYSKLCNANSDVSCHYLISSSGIIFNLLCPSLKAWHAGKSQWQNLKNLNDYSIGIELENKGHEHDYSNYTDIQYLSLKKIIKFLMKNFQIKEQNIIFHSDISPNRKRDPGERFLTYKVGISRFKNHTPKKKKYSILELLKIYGFSNDYLKKYKSECVIAVKRTLNYQDINNKIDHKFKSDFYNLLFK
ncbi:MAG: N-acetylmuramoyl-L-alanine amidase [Alphaproteobacteria bacterium]|tara:strand:+ start:1245 stop:1889 length:645 start_codon:yes stop_codon:yes gene_type:complete